MCVEIQVTITYDSDWKKAHELLFEALIQESGQYTEQARKQQRRRTALFYTAWEVSDPEVHMDIADSGLLFTMKFTVQIGKRRTVITALTKIVLEQFTPTNRVTLAYNTVHVVGVQPANPMP